MSLPRFDITLRRFILPDICPTCLTQPVPGSNQVCHACAQRLPPLPSDRCRLCGGAADGVLDVCGECLEYGDRPWNRAVSVFAYGGGVRALIHQFKYHGATHLVPWFAAQMVENWRVHGQDSPVDAVVPIPLHPLKKLMRGYNQAELLARIIARELHVPLLQPLCRRRWTRQQALLDISRRKANVKDVFGTRNTRAVENLRILMTDDVMTTGATLDAAARILLQQHHAASVAVLTLARG